MTYACPVVASLKRSGTEWKGNEASKRAIGIWGSGEKATFPRSRKRRQEVHTWNRPSGKTQRIYEADINGATSHEQFLKLSADYEAEQKGLTEQGSRHGGTHRTNPTATAGRRSNWSKTSSEKLTYRATMELWNGKEKAGRHDFSAMPSCDN